MGPCNSSTTGIRTRNLSDTKPTRKWWSVMEGGGTVGIGAGYSETLWSFYCHDSQGGVTSERGHPRYTVRTFSAYDSVSRSLRTGRLERELQIVQLSATRCSCIAILWVSLVSFAAVLCVASQRVFIAVRIYFVMDSVRKLLDTPS
jgi:hypothetical protein